MPTTTYATSLTGSNEVVEPSSCSSPINSTRRNRFLVLAGIKLVSRFRQWYGCVLFLTPKICVKVSHRDNLSEASTIQFIRKHTSIPAPKVYCAFHRKGTTYIVMQRMPGMPAVMNWELLSDESKDKLLGQLREMIHEMRMIPLPSDKISNVDGGSLYDCRLPSSLVRFGPFTNTQEFHTFLRGGLEKGPPEVPDIDDMISAQKLEWGQPVFTHGDLSTLNIMIHGDKITGIVDWETGGWYPPYWEYTSASQVNSRNIFWADYIDRFLDPWPEAWKMEKVRQRWWGVI